MLSATKENDNEPLTNKAEYTEAANTQKQSSRWGAIS